MSKLRILFIAAILALLGGCSALNKAGIGGKPELICKWSTGHAEINDRIIGTKEAQAQLSVNRRFEDADALCADLIRAKAVADAYRRAAQAEAEQMSKP